MSSGFKTYQKQFASGGSTVTITQHELGFRLDAAQGFYQIVCTDLGAGSWTVEGLFGDDVWRSVSAAGLVEASIFVLPDDKIVRALRVVFAALAGATPKVTLNVQGRPLRFATL